MRLDGQLAGSPELGRELGTVVAGHARVGASGAHTVALSATDGWVGVDRIAVERIG